MRKVLFAALLLLSLAQLSHAQATIAVSGSKVQGLNGGLLVSGSFCMQATDQNNVNIGVQVQGGGMVVFVPYCSPVLNGTIASFNVPNPATSSPTNVRYRITIQQGSRTVATFPGSYLCLQSGACTAPYAFNFDTCLSTSACIANPIPIVAGAGGPPGATGPAGPPGPVNQIAYNATVMPTEAILNLIAGTNMTIACVDNPGATRTDCTFTSSGGGASFNFSDAETPSGSINGTNVTFTLAHTPNPAASLILVQSRQVLDAGGDDYSIAGATITMTTPPPGGDSLEAWYRY